MLIFFIKRCSFHEMKMFLILLDFISVWEREWSSVLATLLNLFSVNWARFAQDYDKELYTKCSAFGQILNSETMFIASEE